MNEMLIIGVDPAFRKGGFGVCELYISKVFGNSVVFPKRTVLSFVKDGYSVGTMPAQNAFAGVENSNLINAIYINKKLGESLDVFGKRNRDVGKNQAVSQIVFEHLKDIFGEKNVFEISPKAKSKGCTQLEFDSMLKELKIEYNKRTNDDQRVALKIAYMTYKMARLRERVV